MEIRSRELTVGCTSMMDDERAEPIITSFWSPTAVVVFEISSHCLQYPPASYGFFGGKISRCPRTNLLQMVLNLRFHLHLPL